MGAEQILQLLIAAGVFVDEFRLLADRLLAGEQITDEEIQAAAAARLSGGPDRWPRSTQ